MNTNTDNTMQDTQLDGMYRMASKFLGYTGPKTKEALEQFRQSSPAVAAKMKRYSNAMAKGGLMRKGYAEGGVADYMQMGPDPMRNRRQDLRYDSTTGQYVSFSGGLPAVQPVGEASSAIAPSLFPSEVNPGMNREPRLGIPDFQFGAYNDPNSKLYQQQLSDQQMQDMYQQAQADAQRQRAEGFMGRMPLPGEMSFDQFSQNYYNQIQAQPITAQQQATMQPASTGPTPFLTEQPTLPEQPTLEEVPEGATDEERAAIEQRNAEAAQQYQQQAMSALGRAQQNVVMETMTPFRPDVATITPTAGQMVSAGAGQVSGAAPTAGAAQVGTIAGAEAQAPTEAAQITAATSQPEVAATLAGVEAAKGEVTPEAQVAAATQAQTSVSGLEAAQGTAIMMDNPVQREIQAGELVSGAANAAKAAAFAEQIEAAQATPTKKATVAGQLEGLMQDFEGGETPTWAAGAMRTAMQALTARGLGASSIAGQAVVQAAMEAALPIAAADAQTVAGFEMQNLSNRQQRAMLAAQQRATFIGQEFDQAFQARVANASRIADVANMNFTAEQQVALENARAANTMNLQNLTNRQAMVMAEAAALSQLDITNLNNRQQAAVQNAQNFLQMDMANLSNEQQTTLFKAQQNIQAMFTDQAAQNAIAQFNATSENQTNQFFANLAAQTSQFNAAQTNAVNQFNVDAVNSIRTFNAELQQQRDLFNAQNSLVVEQANAQWRQNIATINNAAQNEANMTLAQTLNAISMNNIDQIWQRERDLLSYSVQTANNNADRATEIAIQKLRNEASDSTAAASKSAAFASAAGSIVSRIIFS